MKVLYLLLAVLPLSMAKCICHSPSCPAEQPAACECQNKNASRCARVCGTRPLLQDCSQYDETIRCGSRGLQPCPEDRPWCVNTPEQLANGCTTKADCPGYCVAKSDESCGGFVAFPCETAGTTCVDDPRDDCDPESGGADCSGVCVKFPKGAREGGVKSDF